MGANNNNETLKAVDEVIDFQSEFKNVKVKIFAMLILLLESY